MTDASPGDSELLDAPTAQPNALAGKKTTVEQSAGSAKSPPGPGTRIDGYEIVCEIARGAMGVVFQAKHQQLDRIVALKMVLDADSASDEAMQRFQVEAEAAASLDHPGIVPVYDIGRFGSFPYFTMALVDGPSLAAKLADGPIDPVDAAKLAEQIAGAISYAHQTGVIHRDLKPANILIDGNGNPRITDFGVCKRMHSASEMTTVGQLVGTPHYMPPEQAGGSGEEVSPTSDVYSIGAVLYAMLTGRPPFQAANPIDVVSQVITRDPIPPHLLSPDVPGDLVVIVMKCLAKQAKDRYASASQLADDLKRFRHGEPIQARPPGAWQRARHALRKHVLLASVSGTAASLLVIVAMALLGSLLHTRSQLAQLQEQLDQERRDAARIVVANRNDVSQAGQARAIATYEITRLTNSAERLIEQGQTDAAVQVAIQAATLADHQAIDPPDRLLGLLQGAIDSIDTSAAETVNQADARYDQANDFTQLTDVIDAAQATVRVPLTDFQRDLFGIRDTLITDSNDSTGEDQNGTALDTVDH